MYSNVKSLGVTGVGGYQVSVEVFISNGLPGFDIVGLPDAAVKESRERVRAAIKNNGFKFPVSRITVNLAPADLRKAGTMYDLPILIGILAAVGEIRQPAKDSAFLGELSLTGELRPVAGALPMAIAAGREGFRTLFVPAENRSSPGSGNLRGNGCTAGFLGHPGSGKCPPCLRDRCGRRPQHSAGRTAGSRKVHDGETSSDDSSGYEPRGDH